MRTAVIDSGMMNAADIIEIKKRLLQICVGDLRRQLDALNVAMAEAQADANEHKGAMESRYDTFKEESQALRDGFARQIQEIGDALGVLEQLTPGSASTIQLGAIIETTRGDYFVSTGLVDEEIEFRGRSYHPVSFASPLVSELRRARVGNTISFRGDVFKLLAVR